MSKPIGRPPKYDKEFHPDDFIKLSEQGKTQAQIARAWKVDRDTLTDWGKRHREFSLAQKRGKQAAEAWYMDLGQMAMIGQAMINGQKITVNLGMFCWLTKNMFNWRDRSEQTIEPIIPKRKLTGISRDELTELARRIKKDED